MNNRSKKIYSLGTGLFENAAPTLKISENIEDEIIEYLNINDILASSRVNKNPWNLRMTDEIKRRKNCVTVYTWFGGTHSSTVYWHDGTGTRGTMGHSAIKTYQGGDKNKGVYVSFYPSHGNHDSGTCKKTISHFHKWHDESRNEAKKIDLFGLDIDAINKRFQEICDLSHNARIEWSKQFNCSDLVLELLKIGGIFEKVDYNPFGLKSITSLSIVLSTLFNSVIDSLQLLTFANKLISSPHFWLMSYSNRTSQKLHKDIELLCFSILLNNLIPPHIKFVINKSNYYLGQDFLSKYRDKFQIFLTTVDLMVKGMMNFPLVAITVYATSKYILERKYRNSNLNKISYTNAIKSGCVALFEPIFSHLFSSILSVLNINARGNNFFIFNLLGFNSLEQSISLSGLNRYSGYLFSKLIYPYFEKRDKTINDIIKNRSKETFYFNDISLPLKDFSILMFLIGYPILIYTLLVAFSKMLYDTTTTPKHVYNFSEKSRGKLTAFSSENHLCNDTQFTRILRGVSNKVGSHKSTIFIGVGIGVAAVGFFATKNKWLISNETPKISSNNSLTL